MELSLRFGRMDQEMDVAWYALEPGEKALSPRQLRGETRLILTVQNTAMVHSDGSPIIADVHLNLADAEILYAFWVATSTG